MKKLFIGSIFIALFSACEQEQVCVACGRLCAKSGFSENGASACADTEEEATKKAMELVPPSDSTCGGGTITCNRVEK